MQPRAARPVPRLAPRPARQPKAPLILLLAAFALVPSAAGQLQPPPEVAAHADTDGVPFERETAAVQARMAAFTASVSGQAIHDCVATITQGIPASYRLMGTPTHDLFLDQYADVFGELGLPTALQPFTEGGPGGVVSQTEVPTGGTNIVGVLPGQDATKWVVVGGHYDTREETLGGGALDNASGICTVLELARQAKAFTDANGPLAATLVFLWYDGEEWGLYGSIAFAKDPTVAKQLLGLQPDAPVEVLVSQSFDMPGLNYPAKNTWVQYGDPATTDEHAVLNLRTAPIHADQEWTCWGYGCYEELKERSDFESVLRRNAAYQFLVREVAYDALQLPPEFVWVYDDHYGRSDHIPLIAQGAAGMRIQGSHDNEYPHYHHPTDTLPALYLLAGSQEAFVQGLAAQAQAGGATAFFVALTGGLGHYGDPFLAEAGLLPPTEAELFGCDVNCDQASPAPLFGIAVAGLAVAAFVVRRRG